MATDVRAVIDVARPREQVAAYLRDPGNDPSWIGGLRSARLVTDPPVGVGSRVERVASFLGRRIEYVNEITELTGTRLAMRSVRSPFPMRVTYGFEDAGQATEVSVRVEGDARAIPDGIDRSAYRIIQEALTNTIKHAGLVPTRVTVRYEPDGLVLEVVDEGDGGAAADNGGAGQGLAGMRERVRLHGGELVAEHVAGRGFVVRARIPVAA